MWEIEPVEVKVKIQDKKPLERLAESEVYKIGLDPCYIIIRQEGVFGESIHEFLYINNSLHKVENTFSTSCEICGRLVVGKNNSPYEVNFKTTEEMKNYCDSCIDKYKGWDNYIESKLLFGADSCEDCGKPTNNKVLTGKKIKVQVCEECINGLINIGFEKSIDPSAHKSAIPFPVLIKGKSKKKEIHKLELTKQLKPYAKTDFNSNTSQEVFDEPIKFPRKIPQELIKRKQKEETRIKKEENQKVKISIIILTVIILLSFIGVKIFDYTLKESYKRDVKEHLESQGASKKEIERLLKYIDETYGKEIPETEASRKERELRQLLENIGMPDREINDIVDTVRDNALKKK